MTRDRIRGVVVLCEPEKWVGRFVCIFMTCLPQFRPATPVLRYSDWIAAALVTLSATYLHVLFLLNAGGQLTNFDCPNLSDGIFLVVRLPNVHCL